MGRKFYGTKPGDVPGNWTKVRSRGTKVPDTQNIQGTNCRRGKMSSYPKT